MTARNSGIGTPETVSTCDLHGIPSCRLCKAPKDKRPYAPGSTLRVSPDKKLKASPKRRHITPAEMLGLIGRAKARQGGICIGHLAGIDHECQDPFDAMHVVAQQTIVRKHGEGSQALTDDRLIVYGCRWIHDGFDGWKGELIAPETRQTLMDFAHPDLHDALAEYGLEVEFDREVFGA